MRRNASIICAIALSGFFAVALWSRISSLEAVPSFNGDEAYYGVQTVRLLRGESFAVRTTSNNPLNPFLIGLLVPFHWWGQPSLWVLRAPAVVCGVLVVFLTYFLGSKTLDRTTGLVAAILVAALPVCIFHSRFTTEQSQVPLFGILTIACALRAHGVGLLVIFLASMLDHPTNIFLVPIVLPVYLVQVLRIEGDPARRRRTLLIAAAAGLAIVVAATLLLLRNPIVLHYLRNRPALDWSKFLNGFERLLFFLYESVSRPTLYLHRWFFRTLLVVLMIFGTFRLVRERRWDRIALILGLLASLSGFQLVAGSAILTKFTTHRYGVVFVVPTVLAFACLLRALAPTFASEAGARLPSRFVPVAVAFVLGSALLLSFKQNYFDACTRGTPESLRTLHADSLEPFQKAVLLIREDLARRKVVEPARTGGSKAGLVIVEEYWSYMPIAYLTSSHDQIEVVRLIDAEDVGSGQFSEQRAELIEHLRAGAYAVELLNLPQILGGDLVGSTVRTAFSPEEVQRWEVPSPNGVGLLAVYRLVDRSSRGPVPVASGLPNEAITDSSVRR